MASYSTIPAAADKPLPSDRLAECVASLEAMAAAAAASSDGDAAMAQHSVFLPDCEGVLRPASELTFDDAPWMSAAIRERAASTTDSNAMRFVHSSVSASLAEAMGARSLRYLLLLEEKLTDRLPCPNAEQVRRT